MIFARTRLYKIFLTLLLAFIPLSSQAAGSGWNTIENCDMASASLKELKTENREACQEQCLDLNDCQGIVYISGWKKCHLKGNIKKQAKLRFISGELDAKHDYQAGSFKVDQDHSGKDLERLVLDHADMCGVACAARTDCSSFTYLEGYRVCWLKKAGGRFSNKVFSCSLKK